MCSFFFNDTATTEIYTLSLHDALPISSRVMSWAVAESSSVAEASVPVVSPMEVSTARTLPIEASRSEEHTSELQSRQYLVCRLLLEKKNRAQSRRAKWFTPVTRVLRFR